MEDLCKEGYIQNLVVTEREGKDPLYKFQLKDDDSWYSGFKSPPGIDGDFVAFKYKLNGIWKNVQDIIISKSTHENVTNQDKEDIKELTTEPTLTEHETIIPTSLSPPYYALLLVSTINLCTKKGTTSDEEIKSQYNRFIELVKNE